MEENGLEKILMQAEDSRLTGSWEFYFLFRSRHHVAPEDLMVLARRNVARYCHVSVSVL